MKFAAPKAVLFSRDPVATPATVTTAVQDHRTASPARLTPRQVEVLALLCEGLPNKVICRTLNIAAGTVKVHLSGIFRELGVTSRLQAVVMSQARAVPADATQ
jgi:DNA-binding NarL/FixJ family response regulator